MRATIIVDVNEPEEDAAVTAWFERWRSELVFVSDDQGCGCCVHIWDVDGPADAIAALPVSVRSPTEWAEGR
jgi:hypothetical protein